MSEKFKLLLVEDDRDLALMVSEFLSSHEFTVSTEERGDVAAEKIISDHPDVVVLDVNLPGMDGFSVCRRVREKFKGPIVILTARGEEIDEIVGLEVGADDYLAKPLRPRVLLARLRSHLRKTSHHDSDTTPSTIEAGSLKIDLRRRSVVLDGESIDLTTAEYELLCLLAENAGEVLSRNDIYLKLLEMKYDELDRSIDLRVSRLRRKIGDDPNNPQRVKSVRGVGYILTVDP